MKTVQKSLVLLTMPADACSPEQVVRATQEEIAQAYACLKRGEAVVPALYVQADDYPHTVRSLRRATSGELKRAAK